MLQRGFLLTLALTIGAVMFGCASPMKTVVRRDPPTERIVTNPKERYNCEVDSSGKEAVVFESIAGTPLAVQPSIHLSLTPLTSVSSVINQTLSQAETKNTKDEVVRTTEEVETGGSYASMMPIRVQYVSAVTTRTITTTRTETLVAKPSQVALFKLQIRNDSEHLWPLDRVAVVLKPEQGLPVAYTSLDARLQYEHATINTENNPFPAPNSTNLQSQVLGGSIKDYQEDVTRQRKGLTAKQIGQLARMADLPVFEPNAIRIVPGTTYTALIAIPIDIEAAGRTVEITLYEVPTALDKAGTPIVRSTFSFKFQTKREPWSLDNLYEDGKAFIRKCDAIKEEQRRSESSPPKGATVPASSVSQASSSEKK